MRQIKTTRQMSYTYPEIQSTGTASLHDGVWVGFAEEGKATKIFVRFNQSQIRQLAISAGLEVK